MFEEMNLRSHMPESTTQLNHEAPLPPITPGVYIVGAGPGDPDLLTVKAQKILMQADVILFADSLVPQQILHLCRPDAEIIHTANKTLEDILPLMIERVRSHKSVLRLQSGDPSLYSAIHEQMQALSEADIPFEVIPGISAFQAAAAKLKVELTVPGLVQTIILSRISGRTEVPAREELASLAAHQASLCLYLSARHEMADLSKKENLIRTTLYVISPALRTAETRLQSMGEARSRLYHPEHTHLFRPARHAKTS